MDAKEALDRVLEHDTLTRDEAREAMSHVMSGEAPPAVLAALLATLHLRGESADEIAGFALAMRDAAVRVHAPPGAIDTCGTGGDRANTFNISTVSAVVASAAGARVAKHGNRAASSRCGSADVLEALGVAIDLGPDAVTTCLDRIGIAFMYAPRFHPAMKHAGPVRRELGIRTVFNILGPLANPAGVKRQVLGVPTSALGETMARVLSELGAERSLVVHGAGGIDEISPIGPTMVWDVRGTHIREETIEPRDLGLAPGIMDEVRGGEPALNAEMARRVLGGASGGIRTAVLLNAGAACYVAGLADTVKEGVGIAAETIDSGKAARRLDDLVALTTRLAEAGA
ncbi:MAG TPA: anthranilate phosphoribosyltransferase [Candidatus Limnocylindria bacterium]|nr:anthranilate phosphoribosyltransferase [Candidatus Limnocylindria bacterium]